jgi:rhodanese-related sulfurtransferase
MFQSLIRSKTAAGLKEIIEKSDFLAEVKTLCECLNGEVKGSENIPLDSLPALFSKLKNKNNIIVCCHSGSLIETAKMILQSNGIANEY